MIARIASAALATLLALPLAASAQNASGPDDVRLQMEMKRKRAIVHPTPSPEAVERDVAEAVRAERRERIIRELTRREPGRPDLEYSVTTGIQARNLRELRR
jgi:hypothetical protein